MTSFILSKDFPKGCILFSRGRTENVNAFWKSYCDPDTGDIKHLDNAAITRLKAQLKNLIKIN